jgi:hypothetical protein
MLDKLYDVSDERTKALGEIERDKLRVLEPTLRKLRKNISGQRSRLEYVLPIGPKSNKFRK